VPAKNAGKIVKGKSYNPAQIIGFIMNFDTFRAKCLFKDAKMIID